MKQFWTKAFWKDTTERAVKTAAQTAMASFGVGTGLLDVDWAASASVVGAATVFSILSSIVSSGVGDPTNASLLEGDAPPGRHARQD